MHRTPQRRPKPQARAFEFVLCASTITGLSLLWGSRLEALGRQSRAIPQRIVPTNAAVGITVAVSYWSHGADGGGLQRRYARGIERARDDQLPHLRQFCELQSREQLDKLADEFKMDLGAKTKAFDLRYRIEGIIDDVLDNVVQPARRTSAVQSIECSTMR